MPGILPLQLHLAPFVSFMHLLELRIPCDTRLSYSFISLIFNFMFCRVNSFSTSSGLNQPESDLDIENHQRKIIYR